MRRAEALSLLALPSEPTEQQLKAAYKTAALLWHPDRLGGDHRTMVLVNEAFDELVADHGTTPKEAYVEPGCEAESVLRLTLEQLWKGVTALFEVEGVRLRVPVPALTPEGALLRVRFRGRVTPVRLRVHRHDYWRVRGAHLGMEVRLPCDAFGGRVSVRVPWPDGSTHVVLLNGALRDGEIDVHNGKGLGVDCLTRGEMRFLVRR